MNSILLIDDDPFYAASLKEKLESLSYEVRLLKSPEAAIAESDCHARYSHVLVDFDFRGTRLTGEDVGHMFRQKWPLLARILITAYMQQENAREGYLSVGWDGSIDKEAEGLVPKQIEQRLIDTLNRAKLKSDFRVQTEFPISDDDCAELAKRLDALEKACRHYASKTVLVAERRLIQAACFFLSTEQKDLSEKDVANLNEFENYKNGRRHNPEVWANTSVKMTSQNNWSAFFRIREQPKPKGEARIGRLLIHGLRVRHLIIQNPGRWPLTCSQYGPAIEVVKEFGLSKWAKAKSSGVELHVEQ